jgi:hypothetical protein
MYFPVKNILLIEFVSIGNSKYIICFRLCIDLRLNVMFYILKKISAKSKTDDIFTIAYAYKFYQENIFYWKIHPILDQYC